MYGTIRGFSEETRIFEMLVGNKVEFFYLTRSQFKRFKPYLNEKLVVHFACSDERKKQGDVMAYEVIHFVKILRHLPRKTVVYYDISVIKQGVRKLFNKEGYRLFLDLEFTMPPHGYLHGGGFVPEIIEYGLLLEDHNGQVIRTEEGLIRPKFDMGINSRTTEFLGISEEQIKNAPHYQRFYRTFKDILCLYQPTIYVWGKNDILMLDAFYQQRKVKSLAERKSFVNLMQVIKNYYGIKTDIGLFNAYSFFHTTSPTEQDHNALNDAIATSEIFKLFQKELNTDSPTEESSDS